MKRLTDDADTTDLSLRIPVELKARLVRCCGRLTGEAGHVVGMSELARRAIEEFLARHGVE